MAEEWTVEFTDEFGEWYEEHVPLAERIFAQYLEEIKEEDDGGKKKLQ